MHHEFGITWADGKKERRTSTMVAYGDSKYSAMARTVGVPVGIATQCILNGLFKERGVLAPMHASIYKPMLLELKKHGIKFSDRVHAVE